MVSARTELISVPKHQTSFYTTDVPIKITAIVAEGASLRVKISDDLKTMQTESFLTGNSILNLEIYLGPDKMLVFEGGRRNYVALVSAIVLS